MISTISFSGGRPVLFRVSERNSGSSKRVSVWAEKLYVGLHGFVETADDVELILFANCFALSSRRGFSPLIKITPPSSSSPHFKAELAQMTQELYVVHTWHIDIGEIT